MPERKISEELKDLELHEIAEEWEKALLFGPLRLVTSNDKTEEESPSST
jgi:hypothetical protein